MVGRAHSAVRSEVFSERERRTTEAVADWRLLVGPFVPDSCDQFMLADDIIAKVEHDCAARRRTVAPVAAASCRSVSANEQRTDDATPGAAR
ncbi:hypothetical protein, partial [Ilumatobacter sp.]|uniref:hypothetical protein n=1 Tax=Ilumatobacter sp. TaxID=1967498 RepID=UPI003752E8F3